MSYGGIQYYACKFCVPEFFNIKHVKSYEDQKKRKTQVSVSLITFKPRKENNPKALSLLKLIIIKIYMYFLIINWQLWENSQKATHISCSLLRLEPWARLTFARSVSWVLLLFWPRIRVSLQIKMIIKIELFCKNEGGLDSWSLVHAWESLIMIWL